MGIVPLALGDDGFGRLGHYSRWLFDVAGGGFECFNADLVERREADGGDRVGHRAFDIEFAGCVAGNVFDNVGELRFLNRLGVARCRL